MKYAVFILAVSVLSIILAAPVDEQGYNDDAIFDEGLGVYDDPPVADEDLGQYDPQPHGRLIRGTPECRTVCKTKYGKVGGVCKLLRFATDADNVPNTKLCGHGWICVCSKN